MRASFSLSPCRQMCEAAADNASWASDSRNAENTPEKVKRGDMLMLSRTYITIFASKINHFHKTDFQSFVVSRAPAVHLKRNLFARLTYTTPPSRSMHSADTSASHSWMIDRIEYAPRTQRRFERYTRLSKKKRGKSWNQLHRRVIFLSGHAADSYNQGSWRGKEKIKISLDWRRDRSI